MHLLILLASISLMTAKPTKSPVKKPVIKAATIPAKPKASIPVKQHKVRLCRPHQTACKKIRDSELKAAATKGTK